MFLFSKEKPKLYIACDLNVSHLRMIAFEFSPKEKKIRFISEKGIEMISGRQDTEVFNKACSEIAAFEHTLLGASSRVGSILVSLPYEFASFEANEYLLQRPDPGRLVGPEEIANVWREIENEARQETKKENKKGNQGLLSQEIHEISIDGYPLVKYFSTAGKEIAMEVLSSHMDEALFAQLKKIKITLPEIEFVPRAFLAFDYFLFHTGKEASGVLFDMSEKNSLAMVFQNGRMVRFKLFPFGVAQINEIIRTNFGGSLGDANVMRHQWARRITDNDTSTRLRMLSEAPIRYWKGEWATFLEEVSQKFVVTPHFYIAGEGALIPSLPAELSHGSWLSQFSDVRAVEITTLFPGEKEAKYFPSWPFKTPEDTVLFSLVFRMIHKANVIHGR